MRFLLCLMLLALVPAAQFGGPSLPGSSSTQARGGHPPCPPGSGTPGPGTPGPGSPGVGGPTSPGGFPLLPGAPGTPTGWPFEPGLLGPTSPGTVSTDLFAPNWLRWWRANQGAFLGLRAHVHREPYRTGDVIGFESDRESASRRAPFFPSERAVRESVLPRLLALYEEEDNEVVRRAYLRSLAKASRALPSAERGPVVKRLIEALQERDRETAQTATIALGWTAHPLAARTLADVLAQRGDARRWFRGDVPERTRIQAALGLGRVAADLHQDLRRYAARELRRIVDTDQGGVPDLRGAALLALGLCPPTWSEAPEAAELAGTFQHESDGLVELFLDRTQDDRVRAQAVACWARWMTTLNEREARLEKERFLPLVLGRIRPGVDDNVLATIVVALGDVVDEDDDPLDRRAVEQLLTLDELSPPRWLLGRRWMELARIASRSADTVGVGSTRKDVQRALLKRMVEAKSDERVWCVLALGRLGHELTLRGDDIGDSARAALRVRLTSKPSADEEAALCVVLGWLRDLPSQKLLEERFRSAAQLRVRGFAALGLGLLGERSSLALLASLQAQTNLSDAELETSVTYARALLDDRDIGLVRFDELQRSVALEAKLAQLAAIGEVGDVRVVLPLLEFASENRATALLRAAAVAAAGRIAEPDLRTGPWRFVEDTSFMPWTSELVRGLSVR